MTKLVFAARNSSSRTAIAKELRFKHIKYKITYNVNTAETNTLLGKEDALFTNFYRKNTALLHLFMCI